jgi:hypothetical protein
MPRNPELQERRKQKIIDYYNRLDSVKELGYKKYTAAYCIAKTAEFFDLRPKTIENYLYR